MITGITPRPENLRDALRQGFATATDLADYLTRKGLPFRDAHEAVDWQCAAPKNLASICRNYHLWAELQGFSPLIADDVFAVLTVEGLLASRNHIGGTAPEQARSGHRTRAAAFDCPLMMDKIGKYDLIREIGRGATATVYLANDPFAGRNVAVKVAFPEILKHLERGKM